MPLTKKEIGQIATRTADEVMERAIFEREERELRDHIIGGAMGEGAIPLYGRETRKEPCSCCLIDPAEPNAPENRMCTTSGAIGTLNDREEREWCSEINIVPDGRCARARSIREAARECKERYPEDTTKFFTCYAPAFSQITNGGNPGPHEERIAYVWQDESGMYRGEVRGEIGQVEAATVAKTMNEVKTWAEEQGATKIEMVGGNPDGEPRAKYYYCDNPHLHPNNEVLQIKTLQDNPRCPYCGAVMTYGRYWGPLIATPITDYVTIVDPGGTTFNPGEIISCEAFERENERVKKLGEKPATGR